MQFRAVCDVCARVDTVTPAKLQFRLRVDVQHCTHIKTNKTVFNGSYMCTILKMKAGIDSLMIASTYISKVST